jgi:hypothetical protein
MFRNTRFYWVLYQLASKHCGTSRNIWNIGFADAAHGAARFWVASSIYDFNPRSSKIWLAAFQGTGKTARIPRPASPLGNAFARRVG